MKGFLGFLGTVLACVFAFCVTKLAFEIADSSAKKYYTVDRGL